MSSKLKITISIALTMLIIFLGMVSYSSKITNPLIPINGLVSITLNNEKTKKISNDPVRYISRNFEDFTEYMESEGYSVEQMGRGFQLRKDSESRSFLAEGFFLTKFYIFAEHTRK